MSNITQIQVEKTISAPAEVVWAVLFGRETFTRWTASFGEGSTFEGSWNEGERIRFLAPSGDGIVSKIAENRPNEFLSIHHIGQIQDGKEDTESDAVREWAPVYENYTLSAIPGGIRGKGARHAIML